MRDISSPHDADASEGVVDTQKIRFQNQPISSYRIGFIGAGKVGFTLGKHFSSHGLTLSGYSSRNLDHAREAAGFCGTRAFEDAKDVVAASDIVFLTVPDGAIEDVWHELRSHAQASSAGFLDQKVICHCSGALPSTALDGASDCGAFAVSIHPLFAVSNKYESYKAIPEAVFSLEGDAYAVGLAESLLDACGNIHQEIQAESKTAYHAAAVFASNLVVGLAHCSMEILKSCGFSDESAWKALAPLFLDNAKSVAARGPVDALTGPIERNDVETVRKHRSALDGIHADVYQDVSKVLVEVARRKHPDRNHEELEHLLNEERNQR